MRFTRFLGISLLCLGITVSAIQAATEAAFTQQAFMDAQTAGKPILVDIWASWCPTCKAQEQVLRTLATEPVNKDLVIFRVDFDSQKDVVARLGGRAQSTLIVFRGNTEKGRSVGDTDPASIRALVGQATQ